MSYFKDGHLGLIGASVPKVAKAASNFAPASASAEIPAKAVVQKASSGNNKLAKRNSVLLAGANGANGRNARAAAEKERRLGSENAKVIIDASFRKAEHFVTRTSSNKPGNEFGLNFHILLVSIFSFC